MALQQNTHTLPAQPGQHNPGYQQSSHQPVQRPQYPSPTARRSRGFSFRSNKSADKNTLVETHREKDAKRLHSKADPTMALSEGEPGMVPLVCPS